MNTGLLTISGSLDLAREYAISKNTYVWVLLSQTSATGNVSQNVQLAIISAKSGENVIGWSNNVIDVSTNSDLELVRQVSDVPYIQIQDSPTVTISNLPSVQANDLNAMAAVNIKVTRGGKSTTFTRAVQFTPSGEAFVSASFSRYIDFAILPSQNATASPNQAVCRIASLTGKCKIYRN